MAGWEGVGQSMCHENRRIRPLRTGRREDFSFARHSTWHLNRNNRRWPEGTVLREPASASPTTLSPGAGSNCRSVPSSGLPPCPAPHNTPALFSARGVHGGGWSQNRSPLIHRHLANTLITLPEMPTPGYPCMIFPLHKGPSSPLGMNRPLDLRPSLHSVLTTVGMGFLIRDT